MRLEDLVLVSVDDHVVEPPDLFDGRLSADYAERAPKLIRKDTGIDVWAFEGAELPNIGLNAVAGRPPEEYAMDPQSFDDMRPGCYDIHDRVKDMNANGLLGSMCFPSFPQFCGQLFTRTAKHDEPFAEALVRMLPDVPVEDERRLHDQSLREDFLSRVSAYRRRRLAIPNPESRIPDPG